MTAVAGGDISAGAADLYGAAGRLLGVVRSALDAATELAAGGEEHVPRPARVIAGLLEDELERLGLDVDQSILTAVGWLAELRGALTSEGLRVREMATGVPVLVSAGRWAMHPGDPAGPNCVSGRDIDVLLHRVLDVLHDIRGLRPVLAAARDREEQAPEVAPSDCQGGVSGAPTLFDLESDGPEQAGDNRTVTASSGIDGDVVRQAMDELVREGLHYRTTAAYRDLIRFVSRFRQYSPFNAMLVHLQMPEASYVARASVWQDKFGRRLRPGARPLVMLQPGGPTMPVYDISDTVSGPGSTVPELLAEPFRSLAPGVGQRHWDQLIDNGKLWGIRVTPARMGSTLAGFVRRSGEGNTQSVARLVGQGKDRREVVLSVPVEFEIEVQHTQDLPSQLVTVLHEVAHVLCGHLGAGGHQEWPSRSRNAPAVDEFEAETAAFVACRRLDPDAKIPPYLHGYLSHKDDVPNVSLETMTRAAGTLLSWIERRERVPQHLRKLIR